MARNARTAAVIGGGIVGLAVARELTIRYPGLPVTAVLFRRPAAGGGLDGAVPALGAEGDTQFNEITR